MVLRFKVYRLQWEKLDRRKRANMRLVLRDKNGKILHVCKNKEDEFILTSWYTRYNRRVALEQLLAVRKLKEHIRKVKALVRSHGFTYQLSIYGMFKDPRIKKRFYCRYEVFKATKWTRDEFRAVHRFFKNNKPKSAAGVFVYHNDQLYVWGADKVTRQSNEVSGYRGEQGESQTHGTLHVGEGNHQRYDTNAPA
jgi:hypothetical protein